MSRTFSELEHIHIEHLAPVAIRCCRHLIGGREITAIVRARIIHTDIVHQQGDAVVSVESGFPFSSHPFPNARVDTCVKFLCHSNRVSIGEQFSHRIIDIDIEMFTLSDTGGCYLCLRDMNKEPFYVSNLNRCSRRSGNFFGRVLSKMLLM